MRSPVEMTRFDNYAQVILYRIVWEFRSLKKQFVNSLDLTKLSPNVGGVVCKQRDS